MVDAAANLLDELMGRFRNAAPEEANKKLKWDEEEVCQFYCLRFCPNDLFTNTRADLGNCKKIHDDDARESFKGASAYEKRHLEDEFIRYANNLLRDVDRKIAKGKERLALALKTEAMNLPPNLQRENQEKVALLTEKINDLIKEAEEQGGEGNVEQAQGLLRLVDNLKDEKERLLVRGVESVPWLQTAELAAQQEKQMEVCEICGAFLIVGDAQSRIDDHLMGKLHLGFAQLRVAVEEIMEARKKAEEDREKEREERRRERERGRSSRRSRERGSRDRHRSRDKERSDRRRSRDRDRDRGGRDRHDRDKSRDRERRRSRDRRRSRSRERRHRSGSRDRRRRSRSRSRRRSSSRESKRHRRSRSKDRGSSSAKVHSNHDE